MDTPRLALRLWTLEESDVAAFHRIWGDPEVIFWGATQSVAESRAFLERAQAQNDPARNLGWLAIVERQSGEIVGNAGLRVPPFDHEPGDLEIGWHLRRDRWGRGYATEVGLRLRERTLELGAPRAVAIVLPDNTRSLAVCDRVGLTPRDRVTYKGMEHLLLARDASA